MVFKNTNKPINGNIKSLTIENLKENNENLRLAESESENQPRQTLLSTDSDYLSTRPSTEMTEITNNYKGFEENSSEYVTLLGGDISCQGEEEPEDLGPISTKHLLVWAYQIAKGMEYLGSMKVVVMIKLVLRDDCCRYSTAT